MKVSDFQLAEWSTSRRCRSMCHPSIALKFEVFFHRNAAMRRRNWFRHLLHPLRIFLSKTRAAWKINWLYTKCSFIHKPNPEEAFSWRARFWHCHPSSTRLKLGQTKTPNPPIPPIPPGYNGANWKIISSAKATKQPVYRAKSIDRAGASRGGYKLE